MKRRKKRSLTSRMKANARATAVLHHLKRKWQAASPANRLRLQKRIQKVLEIF